MPLTGDRRENRVDGKLHPSVTSVRSCKTSSLEPELTALITCWLLEARLYKSRGPLGQFIGTLTRSYAEQLAFILASHGASLPRNASKLLYREARKAEAPR